MEAEAHGSMVFAVSPDRRRLFTLKIDFN